MLQIYIQGNVSIEPVAWNYAISSILYLLNSKGWPSPNKQLRLNYQKLFVNHNTECPKSCFPKRNTEFIDWTQIFVLAFKRKPKHWKCICFPFPHLQMKSLALCHQKSAFVVPPNFLSWLHLQITKAFSSSTIIEKYSVSNSICLKCFVLTVSA